MRQLILLTTPDGTTIELEARYHPHIPTGGNETTGLPPDHALIERVYPLLLTALEGSPCKLQIIHR